MSRVSRYWYSSSLGLIPLVMLGMSCGSDATTDGAGGVGQPGGAFTGGASSARGGGGGLGSAIGGASEAGVGGNSAMAGVSAVGGAGAGVGGSSATGGVSHAGAGVGGTSAMGGVSSGGVGGNPPAGGAGGSSVSGASNCPGTYDLPACVADMAKKGGGTVILGEQSYLLKESLILQNKVDIVGQGSGTVIAWDESVKASVDDPLLFSSTVDDISLQSLKLLCSINQDPSSRDLRNNHIGLYLNCGGDPLAGQAAACNDIAMVSLEVAYCSHGIHIKGASGVVATDLDLHHNGNTEVDFFHNIYYRRVGNLTVKQTTPTSGGYHHSPRGHGIRGSHLIDVYFEGLSVYDNADHGIHFDAVDNVRFHNLDVRNNCADPSGSCAPIRCYGTPCDINLEAPAEP